MSSSFGSISVFPIGSEIPKFERKDCEIYYMKKTFEEYFVLKKVKHYEYDFEDF